MLKPWTNFCGIFNMHTHFCVVTSNSTCFRYSVHKWLSVHYRKTWKHVILDWYCYLVCWFFYYVYLDEVQTLVLLGEFVYGSNTGMSWKWYSYYLLVALFLSFVSGFLVSSCSAGPQGSCLVIIRIGNHTILILLPFTSDRFLLVCFISWPVLVLFWP